ncbi:MAG: hypothetical protein K2P86_05165 [Xanthobacteraceae bacterium]|jgi:hypothetical protein|nr:hypothetical protein [Xanthobacteraceae bacterium]
MELAAAIRSALNADALKFFFNCRANFFRRGDIRISTSRVDHEQATLRKMR